MSKVIAVVVKNVVVIHGEARTNVKQELCEQFFVNLCEAKGSSLGWRSYKTFIKFG